MALLGLDTLCCEVEDSISRWIGMRESWSLIKDGFLFEIIVEEDWKKVSNEEGELIVEWLEDGGK